MEIMVCCIFLLSCVIILSMSFRIPVGSEIIPYSSKTGQRGMPRLTSIEVHFMEKDILEKIELENDDNQSTQSYCCLSLGENPSPFDCYLIAENSLEIVNL